MKALTKILAGGAVAAVALASAAPASAQYYPNYGYGYNSGAGIIGQVINSVIGGGYGYQQQPYGYNQGYGRNGQYAVGQCMGAVQQRLSAAYGYNGGYAPAYGGGARVLGISDVEPRSNGGITVRGVANSGRNMAYGGGYGYNAGGQVDLTFKCKTDASGYIVDIDIDQATSAYGSYGQPAYTPYNYDYSQYGYRRY